jgi:hypothetical protein
MGAALRPDLRFPVRAAAGERIVAFGRPGKSPERAVFGPVATPPGSGIPAGFRIGRNAF